MKSLAIFTIFALPLAAVNSFSRRSRYPTYALLIIRGTTPVTIEEFIQTFEFQRRGRITELKEYLTD